MPSSGSDKQPPTFHDGGLAPYAEVVAWRRRFYVALAAALFALLAVAITCAGRA